MIACGGFAIIEQRVTMLAADESRDDFRLAAGLDKRNGQRSSPRW